MSETTDTGILRGDLTGDTLSIGTSFGSLPFGTAGELNEQALRALEAGNAEEAERLWDAALRKDCDHTNAFWNQTLHRMRTGAISERDAAKQVADYESGRPLGLSDQLSRELGTVLAPVEQEKALSFSTTTTVVDARQRGEELLFSVDQNGRAVVERCSVYGGDILGDGLSVGLPDRPLRWSAIHPGRGLEAVVAGDDSLLLYSLSEKRCLRVSTEERFHPRTREERLRLWFSPDGSLLAVSEPRFRDRPRERTILYEVPSLRRLADVERKFVCMTRDNRCIVRGRLPRQKETLCQLRPDGSLAPVFTFEQPIGEANEWVQPPAPFLSYSCKGTEDCFWLDEQFRPHPMDRQLFEMAKQCLFYDPDRGLLYLLHGSVFRNKTLTIWDLNRERRMAQTEYRAGTWSPYGTLRELWWRMLAGAERQGEGWRLCVFENQNVYVREKHSYGWYLVTLPDCPVPERAPWRHSPERSGQEREQEARTARALLNRFQTAQRRNDLPNARAAWARLCDLPGAFGTQVYQTMEDALALWTAKGRLRACRLLGRVGEVPETAMDRDWSLHPGTDGLFALRRPPRPDWEDWPEGEKLYDLDAQGERVIYEERFDYAWEYQPCQLRMKDMTTGIEYPLDRWNNTCRMLFLCDGSVLCEDGKKSLVRIDPERGEALTRHRHDGTWLDYLLDPERRHVLLWEEVGEEKRWTVLDTELHPLCQWSDRQGARRSCVLVPGTGLLAYKCGGRLMLHDWRRNERLYEGAVNPEGSLSVSPDGRTLYAHWRERAERWHLEYDYTTDEGEGHGP